MAVQVLQVAKPVATSLYVPAAHALHDVAPRPEYMPIGHATQLDMVDVPVAAPNVPAGQSV